VKIAFALGMMFIFVPMDIMLEIGGDVGVLIFTVFVIGLLIWLRQGVKHGDNSLLVSSTIT
jgi:hypothetical protein